MSQASMMITTVFASQKALNADIIVELAKNIVNPVRCEWGAGSKVECNVLLGSWALLQKHIHMVHCQGTKDSTVFCRLPQCNQPAHYSHSALVDHVTSAHLSKLALHCPVAGCDAAFLKGINMLSRHYREEHGHLSIGKAKTGQKTWAPVPWKGIHPSLQPFPIKKFAFGEVLVMNVKLQPSQAMQVDIDTMILDFPDGIGSSQGALSQPLSQPSASHISPRKKRTKQLEKVSEKSKGKERETEEEEEGVPSITLDDLSRLSLEDHEGCDFGGSHGDGKDDNLGSGMSHQDPQREEQTVEKTMRKHVQDNMVVERRSMSPMVDLVRPQAMLSTEALYGFDGTRDQGARAPKSILFNTLAKKVDDLEEKGILDQIL